MKKVIFAGILMVALLLVARASAEQRIFADVLKLNPQSVPPCLTNGEMRVDSGDGNKLKKCQSGVWTEVGEVLTGTNVGTGEGIFKDKTSGQLRFRSVKAGTNISLSSSADEVTIDAINTSASAGAGISFFLHDTFSGVSTYESLFTYPSGGSTEHDCATVNNNSVLIEAYASAPLGRTTIDAGAWEFDFHAYATTATAISQAYAEVYSRTSGGTETLLFTVYSGEIDQVGLSGSGTPALYRVTTVQPAFTGLATTTLIVAKYYATTTHVSDTDVCITHDGNDFYSHFTSPLSVLHNDLPGLQGGSATERNHLSNAEVTKVGDAVTAGANVGLGAGQVYKSKSSSTLNLRSIKAGSNVTITNNTDDIEIAASAGGETNTMANVGTGTGQVYRDKVGVNFNLKTVKAGSNITVTNNTDDVTIASTASGGQVSAVYGETMTAGVPVYFYNDAGTAKVKRKKLFDFAKASAHKSGNMNRNASAFLTDTKMVMAYVNQSTNVGYVKIITTAADGSIIQAGFEETFWNNASFNVLSLAVFPLPVTSISNNSSKFVLVYRLAGAVNSCHVQTANVGGTSISVTTNGGSDVFTGTGVDYCNAVMMDAGNLVVLARINNGTSDQVRAAPVTFNGSTLSFALNSGTTLLEGRDVMDVLARRVDAQRFVWATTPNTGDTAKQIVVGAGTMTDGIIKTGSVSYGPTDQVGYSSPGYASIDMVGDDTFLMSYIDTQPVTDMHYLLPGRLNGLVPQISVFDTYTTNAMGSYLVNMVVGLGDGRFAYFEELSASDTRLYYGRVVQRGPQLMTSLDEYTDIGFRYTINPQVYARSSLGQLNIPLYRDGTSEGVSISSNLLPASGITQESGNAGDTKYVAVSGGLAAVFSSALTVGAQYFAGPIGAISSLHWMEHIGVARDSSTMSLAPRYDERPTKMNGPQYSETASQFMLSQAEWVGSVKFGTDCAFIKTSSTMGDVTDATCTTTATEKVAALSGVTAGVKILSPSAGSKYILKVTGGLQRDGADNFCVYRFTDGTAVSTDGVNGSTSTVNTTVPHYEGELTLTDGASDIRFQMRSSNNTNECKLWAQTGLNPNYAAEIQVLKIPSGAQLAAKPDQIIDRTGEVFAVAGDCPTGTIPATNKTIGKSSGNYIGQDYKRLYDKLWGLAGLSTTAGHPFVISSAKGASAQADWDAGKTIAADLSTNGLHVRQQGGLSGVLGAYQADELYSHTHTINKALAEYYYGGNIGGSGPDGVYGTSTSNATGGNETRPKNVALNYCVNWRSTQPVPVFAGAVTSGYSGVANAEWATTGAVVCSASPCTLTNKSSGIETVTRISQGQYSANFVAGRYAVAPVCFQMGDNANDVHALQTATQTTSQWLWYMYKNSSPFLFDSRISIFCFGGR